MRQGEQNRTFRGNLFGYLTLFLCCVFHPCEMYKVEAKECGLSASLAQLGECLGWS